MSKLGKIMIVDDDANVLETLNLIYRDEYEVVSSRTGEEALELIAEQKDFDAVVLDIKMARMDGLAVATQIAKAAPDLPVIFHTAYPGEYDEEDIDEQFQPFDYVGKDERPVRLQRAVRQAVKFSQYQRGSVNLVEHARIHFNMVGHSKAMLEVYQAIEMIGPKDSKVIIFGSTGTGKELVAKAIHKMSFRAERRMVSYNCNPHNQELVETELFGYVKGAFTGADTNKIGNFEFADGGTLFLDEVGDLSLSTQGRLLRVLENGIIQRLGSPEPIKVDVRVVCATHRNLKELVNQGKFREDLYYRLQGVTIVMPDLKDRAEDIPQLIDHFVNEHCRQIGIPSKVIEPAARDLLVSFEWPGNVRQLMYTIQSLIDLTPSHFISYEVTARKLGLPQDVAAGNTMTLNDHVREFKRKFVASVLARNNGNQRAAAKEIGMDPSNLSKLLRDLELV